MRPETSGVTAPAPGRLVLVGLVLGNTFELYDFIVYSFFAIQIGQAFFPAHDAYLSLMASLAVFAVGFIGRPIGAWWLGRMADRRGRNPALFLTMVLMGAGTAVIVLCPPFATIGIAAPLVLIAARFMQGLALGGEIGIATCCLTELAAPDRRGVYVNLQPMAQGVAQVFAPLVGLCVTLAFGPASLAAWGWRLALGIGLVVVPIAIVLRRNLPETHAAPSAARPPAPILPPEAVRPVLLGMAYIACNTIQTYCFGYTATFAQNTLHLSAAVGLGATIMGALVSIPAVLAGGWLGDRFGRKPPLMISLMIMTVIVVPLFEWIIAAPGIVSLGGSAMIGVLFATLGATATVMISESLPHEQRGHLFSLVYALPVCVFGGTTQLGVTWLLHVTGSPMALAWLRCALFALSLVIVSQFHESAPRRMLRPAAA